MARLSELHRYGINFDGRDPDAAQRIRSLGLVLGCGITAFSIEDAMQLLRDRVFRSVEVPEITSVVEDVDVSTLDPRHIQPNMLPPISRGVWFPLGHADFT